MECGQALELISRAIDAGHAPAGYLIVGDLRGNCEELVTGLLHRLFPDEPERIDAGTHPDVAVLLPEGKSRQITVGAMRERIVEPMEKTAYSGGWKVGIIYGADRLNSSSANCFLKSLEEPTPKTIYFLLTDQPDVILPTIVSRTQRVDLPLSEGLLDGEVYEAVAQAFAARSGKRLAAILGELKESVDDADVALERKRFFKTLMSFARKLMLGGRLANHLAFHNIAAVEEAYRQCERSMGDEAVLSFMMDRMRFPEPAKEK